MVQAADVLPNFLLRRSIEAADLPRLAEPAVIFEGTHTDSDGAVAYIYTVAGWLDGANIATAQGGCTVGGQTILVHARNRAEADMLAGLGLQDTIEAVMAEGHRYTEALDALARLESVNAKQRLELATKPLAQQSDEFIADTEAIRPLRGDDIVLASGGTTH